MHRFPRCVPTLARYLPRLIATALIAGALAGCGTLNSWAQIGPSLKPSIGSSVSIPLGK